MLESGLWRVNDVIWFLVWHDRVEIVWLELNDLQRRSWNSPAAADHHDIIDPPIFNFRDFTRVLRNRKKSGFSKERWKSGTS